MDKKKKKIANKKGDIIMKGILKVLCPSRYRWVGEDVD